MKTHQQIWICKCFSNTNTQQTYISGCCSSTPFWACCRQMNRWTPRQSAASWAGSRPQDWCSWRSWGCRREAGSCPSPCHCRTWTPCGQRRRCSASSRHCRRSPTSGLWLPGAAGWAASGRPSRNRSGKGGVFGDDARAHSCWWRRRRAKGFLCLCCLSRRSWASPLGMGNAFNKKYNKKSLLFVRFRTIVLGFG